MAPEMQVKQFVAVVHGAHGHRFAVFVTASAQHYLFAQVRPDGTFSGLAWPVLKRDLRPHVRRALAHGHGNANLSTGAHHPRRRRAPKPRRVLRRQ